MKDHYAMDNNGGLLAFQLRLCGKQLSPQATKCLLAAMLMISVALSAALAYLFLTTQNAAEPAPWRGNSTVQPVVQQVIVVKAPVSTEKVGKPAALTKECPPISFAGTLGGICDGSPSSVRLTQCLTCQCSVGVLVTVMQLCRALNPRLTSPQL